MRAVLLPTWGDPFLLKLWFHLFKTVWQDEVDKVYVLIDSKGTDQPKYEKVDQFIIKTLNHPKIEVKQNTDNFWTTQFQKLITNCKEDYFAIVQDDAFIFKKGALDKQFKKIEQGKVDFIGSRIGTLSDNLETFWLNFFFARTKDVLATSMDMNVGTYKGQAYDMFGKVSMELQQNGLSFELIQQDTDEWTHVTQLSGIRYALYRDPDKLSGVGNFKEIMRRVGWWASCWELYQGECEEIAEFTQEYKKAILKHIESVLP